ncbi:hypothetical protein AB3S75_030130 [Citrus x aurantiifolia]
MESKNSTFGSIGELKEPLIRKEESSEPPQVRLSMGGRVPRPHQVISAPHPEDFETEKNKSISIDLGGPAEEMFRRGSESLRKLDDLFPRRLDHDTCPSVEI